jgi:hypothetical protein
MRLTPPKRKVFRVSVYMGIASLIPALFGFFWLAYIIAFLGLVNLAAGNFLKGY